MRKQQESASPKESTGAKPKTYPGGTSKKAEKLHDDGKEDISIPKSNSEVEIRVVTLLPPNFLRDAKSTSIDRVLLSMKLTEKPIQDKETASETSSNTNGMEDHTFSSARESEPDASHARKEKKAFHNPLNIVSREQWEAINPRKVFYRPLFPYFKVNINYYNVLSFDLPKEGVMWGIKKKQEISLKLTDDIPCNFVVDSHGLIYEGRGWDAEYEPGVFRIDIIGNYSFKLPSDKEFLACRMLIQEGVRLGKIIHNYWLMSANPICEALFGVYLNDFVKDLFN